MRNIIAQYLHYQEDIVPHRPIATITTNYSADPGLGGIKADDKEKGANLMRRRPGGSERVAGPATHSQMDRPH
jgi:hypothetical protein